MDLSFDVSIAIGLSRFFRIGNPALRAITKIGIPTSVFDAKMAHRLPRLKVAWTPKELSAGDYRRDLRGEPPRHFTLPGPRRDAEHERPSASRTDTKTPHE